MRATPLTELAARLAAQAAEECPEAPPGKSAREGAEAALWQAATHPEIVKWLTRQVRAS